MTPQHFAFKALGSPCLLQLYGDRAAKVATQAQQWIADFEARYSRYRNDSIVSKINAEAGGEAIRVDAETAALLNYADTAWQQSEGRFDITSGVLRRAWNFRSGRLPEQAQIDALLPLVGWSQVEWQAPLVRLPQAGMQIDFGGFGKEYIADLVAKRCHEAGIRHGLVDLGGDIQVIGPHPDGTAWRVGIRDPNEINQALTAVDLLQGGIASSGNYERCMVVDGRRYGHILDPHSGWPVEGLHAVSVLAPQCLVAGTASTIAMLMPEAAGLAWLTQLGQPWLAVDRTGRRHDNGSHT